MTRRISLVAACCSSASARRCFSERFVEPTFLAGLVEATFLGGLVEATFLGSLVEATFLGSLVEATFFGGLVEPTFFTGFLLGAGVLARTFFVAGFFTRLMNSPGVDSVARRSDVRQARRRRLSEQVL